MENKIPKIIHYCWFGGTKIPAKEQKCMETWKKVLPEYKFMFWNEDTFDINSTEWTRTAYELGKYAFVADYVRLYVLKNYGGIYLDTDVKVIKSFSPLLYNNHFFCFEDVAGEVIASCVIGSEKNSEFIGELLTYYNRKFDMCIIEQNESNAVMFTAKLVAKGLKLNSKMQLVENIKIYPRTYFCPMDFWGNWNKTKDTYCIHLFSGSWLEEADLEKHRRRQSIIFRVMKRMYNTIGKISILNSIKEYMKKRGMI